MNESREDDVVEELIAEALRALEDGGEEALEAHCRSHPDYADRIRRAVAALQARGLASQADPGSGEVQPFPEKLGNYRLVRPLGGGGMGIVYLAQDEELGRAVALKLVRPDQLHFPGARRRFRREIETIARMHHAGIVPLYSVGEDRGLPYYAMELVPGLTLAEVIAELRDRRPAELGGALLMQTLPPEADESGELDPRPSDGGLFRGSWEEVCLRIAREVAEALEHAHRRGVVHRDVKPSNVMLTRGGRVLLLDFGLSSQRGDTRITRSGAPLGSLAYMSPEMLRGEARDDDARLDVYSLGVTLYELLTLSLPFSSDSEGALRESILKGASTPARRRNAELSWEAETLTQVALDPDQTRRYETAEAFARDITNALSARPLEARRPGPWLRARRWVQRHPVHAAVLTTLVVGPSLLAVQEYRNARIVLAKSREIEQQSDEIRGKNLEIEAKNAELAAALAEAGSARDRAEENFEKAREAVDRMLTDVGGELLREVPQVEGIRRELLIDALEFYEWFLDRGEGGDRSLRIDSAKAAWRAATLHSRIGRLDQAERLLDRSEAAMRELLGEAEDEHLRLDLVSLLQERARLARAESDLARASEWIDEARSVLGNSASDRARNMRAFEAVERGNIASAAGDFEGAIGLLEEAIEDYQVLLAAHPEDRGHRMNLSIALDDLGSALHQTVISGRAPDEALARIERAIELHTRSAELISQLQTDEPNRYERSRLMRAIVNQAALLERAGRFAEAETICRKALEIGVGLVDDFPTFTTPRSDLAVIHENMASLSIRAGRFEEAEQHALRAIEHLRILGIESSVDPGLLGGFGVALVNLAVCQIQKGEMSRAVASYESATEQFGKAVAQAPSNAFYAQMHRDCVGRLNATLLMAEEPARAFERAAGYLENEARFAADYLLGAALITDCIEFLDRRAESDDGMDAAFYAERSAEILRPLIERGALSKQDLLADARLERLLADPGFADALEL